MCGAEKVVGVDIDTEAIESAQRSWSMNSKNQSFLDKTESRVSFLEVPEDPMGALNFMQNLVEDRGTFGAWKSVIRLLGILLASRCKEV